MILNKKTEYAISILVYVYQLSRSEDPITTKQIFNATEIPKKYLTVILSELQRYGLLKSIKGFRGGYRAVKGLENISLLDIVKATAHQQTTHVKILMNDFQKFSRKINDEVTTEFEHILDKLKFLDLYKKFEELASNNVLMYEI
ncbi:MAG: Rrf2 family transcriptional regulator [Deltaproteobacteria bacterium]|nr:Rrf2 family transcriptional regulator [Deltaproteobacteria bacterium]